MPFLKWAGGKRRLVHRLAEACPDHIERYFEPFLGSGALFLHLAQNRPSFPATLSDSNEELVNVYMCVRDRVGELAEVLGEHEKRYYRRPKRHYYLVRDDVKVSDRIERAARMIFLNKTCYNGLYRVNRSGKFNVPHGSYVRPAICNRNALFAASDILNRKEVSIKHTDYRSATASCRPGDLVYLDPPYLPLTKTANFTDYTSESFDYDDHVTLAKEFRRLTSLGCTVVLSNSNSDRIKNLYDGFDIQRVDVSRPINCNARKRAGQSELVITNTFAQVIHRLPRRERQSLPTLAPRML